MRLTLLTYNIHKAIGVDRRFAPDRIAEILAYHNADIVLLQEVDRHAPRSSHLDLASYLARALKYPYRAVGMNVFLRKGRYGNATLSRFPISRQRNIDLTIRWRKRRGAQHTQIFVPDAAPSDMINPADPLLPSLPSQQAPLIAENLPEAAIEYADRLGAGGDGLLGSEIGRPLVGTDERPMSKSEPVCPRWRAIDVFNVHLGLSAAERAEQMERLFATPDLATLSPEAPCIVAGDTNDWRGLLRRGVFRRHGFLCASNRRHGAGASIKTFPSYAPTGGLDRVYCRGPLRPVFAQRSRLKIARVASDHLPLIVELEMVDEPVQVPPGRRLLRVAWAAGVQLMGWRSRNR